MKLMGKLLLPLCIASIIGCSSGSDSGSDSGSGTAPGESIPTDIVSGVEQSSATTGVKYSDQSGRGSSCSYDRAGDIYVETERFIVFGQDGVAESTKQLVGAYAENALGIIGENLGIPSDEILSLKSHYDPSIYVDVYLSWTTDDVNNAGFTVFEMNEPFIQDFHGMSDHEKNIEMYQYWISLSKDEQSEVLRRLQTSIGYLANKAPEDYPAYGDKMNVCVTTSGYAGVGYDFGFDVLDPQKAIGSTTSNLEGYQQLITHELTHTVAAVITRKKSGNSVYWLSEGLPEYISGHTAANSAKELGVNVVSERIVQDELIFSEYPTFNYAVKYIAEDMNNGSEVFGKILLDIRNDDQRFGGVASTNLKDPDLNIDLDFLRAFENNVKDLNGTPVSYLDYIHIYQSLL